MQGGADTSEPGTTRMVVVGLGQQEQRAFERLVADLRIDDPKFITQLHGRSQRQARRIRTIQVWMERCVASLP